MFKKISKIIFSSLIYISIAFVIGCLGITAVQRAKGEQPNLFGYTIYVIQTNSMTGELEVRDAIVSKRNADYEVGSVVTYIATSGLLEGQPITHKIVKIYEENGVEMIQTQGVKPGATLDTPIKSNQIEAVMQSKIDLPVKLINFFQKPIATFFCLLVPIGIYACYEMYVLILKKEKVEE